MQKESRTDRQKKRAHASDAWYEEKQEYRQHNWETIFRWDDDDDVDS